MAEVKLNFLEGEEFFVTISNGVGEVLRIDEQRFSEIVHLVNFCDFQSISLKTAMDIIANQQDSSNSTGESTNGDWFGCDGGYTGRGERLLESRNRVARVRARRGSTRYQPLEPVERNYDNRRKQLHPDEGMGDAFGFMLDNLANQCTKIPSELMRRGFVEDKTSKDFNTDSVKPLKHHPIEDLHVDTEGLKRLQMRVGGLQHLSELSVEELRENFSKDELENILSTLLEYKQQLQDGDDGQHFFYYVTSEYGLPKDLPFDQLKNIYGWVTEAKSLKSFLDNYKDKSGTAFDIMRKRQELLIHWLKDVDVDLVKIGLEEPVEIDEEQSES